MTNLRLTGFIIFGLSLTMGIIMWAMHEQQWAKLFFVLGALQVAVSLANWKHERKRHKPRK